jgi:hypothetical protein
VTLGVAGAGEEDWTGTAAVPPVPPVGPLTDSSITASVRQKARKGDMENAGEGLDRWDRGRGPTPLSLSAIWKFTMLCGVWHRLQGKGEGRDLAARVAQRLTELIVCCEN